MAGNLARVESYHGQMKMRGSEAPIRFLGWLWKEWLFPLVVAVAILAPVRSAIADWNDVPTGSMKPTIVEGDRIFVNKLAYDLKVPFTTMRLATWGDPARGDVVVLFSPVDETRLVKRVIGLPGDVIELHDNVLSINGREVSWADPDPASVAIVPVDERREALFAVEQFDEREYPIMVTPSAPAIRTIAPFRIADGAYFVMGDNRDNSLDSRFFGFVERRLIVGEAVGVAFSLDPANHYFPRSDRFMVGLN